MTNFEFYRKLREEFLKKLTQRPSWGYRMVFDVFNEIALKILGEQNSEGEKK